MSTWEQSELAITQSLQRIEASVARLEQSMTEMQASVAEQRGKASTMTVWISLLVSGIVTAAIKRLWK